MTTPTLPEAARMALEAIEAQTHEDWDCLSPHPKLHRAADALRAALAASEAQAEPLAQEECPKCDGTGRVDDPNECPCCGMAGCRTVSCEACEGSGVAPKVQA